MVTKFRTENLDLLRLDDSRPNSIKDVLSADSELEKNFRLSISLLERIRRRGDERWYVMFSGGKDSTLLTVLVMEYLQQCSGDVPDTHVVYTDSRLEFPQAKAVALDLLSFIKTAAERKGLDVETHYVTPKAEDSYWVNMIGRGYTPPRAHFRWCTPRLKMRPSWDMIAKEPETTKAVLTGVRYDESNARKTNLELSCAKGGECGQDFWIRYGPKGSGITYFAPIVSWRTCKVWDFLTLMAPAFGWPTAGLINLYGGQSLRFGCWTCTLVSKDRAAESLISRGDGGPLAKLTAFRSFLDEASRNEDNRHRDAKGGLHGF